MEQPTSEKVDILVTHFRENLKKFLKEAQESGSITIKQGNIRFHVVATKNCADKRIKSLYY